MRKLILTFCIAAIAVAAFSQTPPSLVINTSNGLTYTRILTVQEYISVGGDLAGEVCAPEAGKSKKSGSTLACPKGAGCCWHSIAVTTPGGGLGEITLPAQIGDDGSPIEETTGLYAYYNAEIDEIIFR